MNKKKQQRQTSAKISKGIDRSDHTYYHYLLLLTCCFILYGWTAGFKFSLDDDYILTYLLKVDNSLSGIISIFKLWYANADYRPVTILSFWIERALFHEINPSISHLINVLLYGLLSVSIYRLVIVSRFFEDEKTLKALALLSALLFIVHPNHVSVVANIKSRDNLLSMFFGILAAIQLIRLYDQKQYWRILLFIPLIVLGILSKLDAYSFIAYPALVILFFRKQTLKQLIPVIIITWILFLIVFGIRNNITSHLDKQFQTFTLGIAENPLNAGSSAAEKLSLTCTTLLYYIKFLFIPFSYYFYYGYDQIPLLPLFSPLNILCAVIFLTITAGSFYLFRRNRIYLFSLLFFSISISYALNFYTPVAGIVMDRYNFIPSIAFSLSLASLLITSYTPPGIRIFRNSSVSGILLIYALFTIYRTSAWKDSFTLFDRDLPHLTRSVNANRIAGGTYIHLALQEENKPGYDRTLTDSFIHKGERYAKTSLLVSDQTSQVWELLGLSDLYRKDDSSALEKFKKCFALDTSYLSGINYLGFTYWNLGKIDSAYHYFSYVMQREPFFNYSANNMINLLVKNNRMKEADSILNVLYKRYPDDVRLLNKMKEFRQSNAFYFRSP